MAVRKRGGRWHFDFMIKRTRYRGTIAESQTKHEAKDAEAAIRREVFEGTYGKPKGDDIFAEYAEEILCIAVETRRSCFDSALASLFHLLW